jgi:hypothetical protein
MACSGPSRSVLAALRRSAVAAATAAPSSSSSSSTCFGAAAFLRPVAARPYSSVPLIGKHEQPDTAALDRPIPSLPGSDPRRGLDPARSGRRRRRLAQGGLSDGAAAVDAQCRSLALPYLVLDLLDRRHRWPDPADRVGPEHHRVEAVQGLAAAVERGRLGRGVPEVSGERGGPHVSPARLHACSSRSPLEWPICSV